MQTLNLEEFHDWIIGPIVIDWVNGIVKVRLHLERNNEIEIAGLRTVSISRNFPWGLSQYINSIKCERRLEEWLLEIELQSGDIITVASSEVPKIGLSS